MTDLYHSMSSSMQRCHHTRSQTHDISPNMVYSMSEREASDQTPVKLRDSCNPCAAAKVRCNKEKPSCSRCSSRKTRCEYGASKRSGRQSTTAVNPTTPGQCSGNSTQVKVVESNCACHSSGTSGPIGAWRETARASDRAERLTQTQTVDPARVSSKDPSPSLSDPKAADLGVDEINDYFDTRSAPLMIDDDRDHLLHGNPVKNTASDIQHTPPPASQSTPNGIHCLSTALGLLRRLDIPSAPAPRSDSSTSTSGSLPHTFKAAAPLYEQVVLPLGKIVGCDCVLEENMLLLTSMILLKVISWYARTARDTQIATPHLDMGGAPTLGSLSLIELLGSTDPGADHRSVDLGYQEREDLRVTAEEALNNLYHVRDIVDRFSKLVDIINLPDGTSQVADLRSRLQAVVLDVVKILLRA
jgi:hypothetical protein